MSPLIAILICTFFVCAALRFDARRTPSVSNATWIPLIWLAILASKPVGEWVDPSTTLSANVEDGSPLDRVVLSALMLFALAVLIKRKLQWTRWIKGNAWIVVFALYCALSIVWSDFPAVAFKRWIRGLGSALMILVILSEEDPLAAIAAIVRRCSFVLVPFSIILIKYYRDFGVGYNFWTGEEYLVGVTTDKNALGRLCLISGLFALWELFTVRQYRHTYDRALDKLVGIAVFSAAFWLLLAAQSATSLASFLFGCCVLVVVGRPTVKKHARYLGILIALGAGAAAIVFLTTDLVGLILASLGRNATLTDRTFVWDALLAMETNPFVGVGYDSFWLGDRLETFVRAYMVNEAHNGYLEIYLELGLVGVFLFAGMLLSIFAKAKRSLQGDVAYGKLRMAVLAVFLIYNVAESGYKPTTLICFVLLLVATQRPSAPMPRRPQAVASVRRREATTRPNIGLITNDRLQLSGGPRRGRGEQSSTDTGTGRGY